MRVAYYCQHVLGIGHFHRSLAICQALAQRHPTTLILGGPDVEITTSELNVFKLPGLKMDKEFKGLVSCEDGRPVDEVKSLRPRLLLDFFTKRRFEVFITELYPFGRKAFAFEILPILKAIKTGSLGSCQCYSSVRDILVEKAQGMQKHEDRVVSTINTYYQGVFIHADPKLLRLEETFPRLGELSCPCHYTGFVSKPPVTRSSSAMDIREKLGLTAKTKLIVASIGGGNVGAELLEAAVKAFAILNQDKKYHLQLFCGPYSDRHWFTKMQQEVKQGLGIARFTDDFSGWLAAADLSISMAGYNTTMDLAAARIPALLYPFGQNREQRLRAERFAKALPFTLLTKEDLAPKRLAALMTAALKLPAQGRQIALNGAEMTAEILEKLQ